MHPDFKLVALWCCYRGAGFHGFQHVEGKRTVQSALLEAERLAPAWPPAV